MAFNMRKSQAMLHKEMLSKWQQSWVATVKEGDRDEAGRKSLLQTRSRIRPLCRAVSHCLPTPKASVPFAFLPKETEVK